jgi:hypothetical protein
VGFYYGSGAPPEDPNDQGSFKEAMLITWAVFKTLALPLGILLGGIAYIVFLFYLFSIHPLLGLAGILVVVAAISARGLWEWRHPPSIDKLDR